MANRFWVGGSATWDASTTANWSTTSGGASGASVPGSGDTAIFDGGSGAAVVTVAADRNGTSLAALTMTGTGNFTGTLDFATNGPISMTMSSMSFNGAGARTVNLGSGTFTITGASATLFDLSGAGALTLNQGTATIQLTNTSPTSQRTININGKIIANITLNSNGGGSYEVRISGGGTVNNLTVNGPQVVAPQQAMTIAAATLTGTSLNNLATLYSSNVLVTVTISGTWTATYARFANITFSGGTVTATNSIDDGRNTNLSVTNPSTGGVIGG